VAGKNVTLSCRFRERFHRELDRFGITLDIALLLTTVGRRVVTDGDIGMARKLR